MFTVCPKCALTLVVTAADLRVAQGYVRCGRCSNVFNALSRLSEDRQAAAMPAQSSPESTASRAAARNDPASTSRTRVPDPSSTARTRTQDSSASSKFRLPGDATTTTRKLTEAPPGAAKTAESAQRRPAQPPPKPPAQEPTKYYDDDSILEEDLEFNADSDVSKVFVEQPPSPEFQAATGTFKALKLGAE